MTKVRTLNLRQALRYLVFMMLSLFVVAFCLIYIYPTVVLPAISGSSLAIHLLAVLPCGLLVSFLITYLALKLVTPATEKTPIKGLRQWIVGCVLVLGYLLTWVLLAFIFETFTPFLPIIVSGVILPLYALLMILIVLLRTRARDRIEQLLKRLFKENI